MGPSSSPPPVVAQPPPEFKPPPGFRYHGTTTIKNGNISGTFSAQSYNSSDALVGLITNGRPGQRICFPKGTIFIPAAGSRMQNLVLRDAVEVVVGAGGKTVFAYCGNQNFGSPDGPMIPTDKVLDADLSSQQSVWRATFQILKDDRN
eukprot:TRINITY_DN2739_c0_g1_i1.p1 TRINITY_DN2739_c0_g1~~TRINITY_DN2739_c0_g1_i1.p1  ORF type:complete len:148 (+),score=28.86 TRINITY_DN2739_c0_g1_i1:97-540(+)